jgi:hypothetical protein
MGRQIYDITGNVTRVAHTDGSDEGRVAWETIEDHAPTVESAKLLREHVTRKDPFRHVARVPLIVYEQALREGWADDEDKWREWLNDADNAAFRVWMGRV